MRERGRGGCWFFMVFGITWDRVYGCRILVLFVRYRVILFGSMFLKEKTFRVVVLLFGFVDW